MEFKIRWVRLVNFQNRIKTFVINKHRQDIIHRHFIEKIKIIYKTET